MTNNMSMGQFPNLLQNDKLLVKMPTLTSIETELQFALRYLTQHSLTHSAKWVGQLLLGITTHNDIQESFLIKSFIHSNTDPHKQYIVQMGESEPLLDTVLMVAKNLFELREYKKCSNMLKEHLAIYPQNQSLIFYYYYSLWMSGLIRKQEEIYENCNLIVNIEGTHKPPQHSEIHNLERDLKKLYNQRRLHGINLYLYGLVLRQQERTKDARRVFIECLNQFPYIWSAWIQLCKIIQSEDMVKMITFRVQQQSNQMTIGQKISILVLFAYRNIGMI